MSLEQSRTNGAARRASTGESSRPPKAAMLVAQRIVRDIVRGRLTPGDLLPPERSMLETYSTGRGTLREALRLLEFQGVISLKPGPGGGPVLQAPAASHLAGTLMLLMQLNRAPYRVIVEARALVEPIVSQLAAAHMSAESLEELGATIEQMREDPGDRESFLAANRRFHDVIAWASGNILFAYLVESLLGILDDTVIGIDYPNHRRTAIVRAHEEIFTALSRGDAGASANRMREHIEAHTRYAKKRFPDVFEQTVTWDGLIG